MRLRLRLHIDFDFWLWLCRFAYRRMHVRELNSLGRVPVGIPGMRDPDKRCAGFAPRKRDIMDWPCQGDGHYLCHEECAHFVPE